MGCSTENEKEDFGNNKEICIDDKIKKNCRLTCGLCQPNTSLKVDESSDTCKLPLDKMSRCRARKLRYYFNSTSGQCDTFYYGGCDGNKNNFETYEDCENLCIDTTRSAGKMKKEGDECGPSFTLGDCDEGL